MRTRVIVVLFIFTFRQEYVVGTGYLLAKYGGQILINIGEYLHENGIVISIFVVLLYIRDRVKIAKVRTAAEKSFIAAKAKAAAAVIAIADLKEELALEVDDVRRLPTLQALTIATPPNFLVTTIERLESEYGRLINEIDDDKRYELTTPEYDNLKHRLDKITSGAEGVQADVATMRQQLTNLK